jgi:drug/metabolite transporter (DMT)-like permease
MVFPADCTADTLNEVDPKAMIRSYRRADLLLMHVIVLIWGYTGIIGKWSELPADVLVFLRMLIAACVLVPIVTLRGAFAGLSWGCLLKYLGVGVVIAGHWVTFFAAIDASNVSVALACMAATPVFAALLEPLLCRRSFVWSELGTAGVAALGIALIFGAAGQLSLGVGLALVSSVLAALFTILNGALFRAGGRASVMAACEMVGGVAVLLILQLVVLRSPSALGAIIAELPAKEWVLVGVLGLVCTALPFIFAIKVMRTLSPFSVCLSVNLEPVYAILLALLHFGETERMTLVFYVGAALTFLAVLADGLLKVRSGSQESAPA